MPKIPPRIKVEIPATSGVYAIRNMLDNKWYVGSAAWSLKNRWNQHRNQLRYRTHFNRHLQAAWNRDGESAFEFIVLEICHPSDCIAREQYYIDVCHSYDNRFGYNSRPNAESNLGATFGPQTEEDRKKRSEGLRRAYATGRRIAGCSAETRAKISATQVGVPKSEEFKEKLRKARTGWKFSDETLRKMSESAKRRGISQETRDKILAAKLTRESRAKASTSAKRRGIPEEQMKRMIAASLKKRRIYAGN